MNRVLATVVVAVSIVAGCSGGTKQVAPVSAASTAATTEAIATTTTEAVTTTTEAAPTTTLPPTTTTLTQVQKNIIASYPVLVDAICTGAGQTTLADAATEWQPGFLLIGKTKSIFLADIQRCRDARGPVPPTVPPPPYNPPTMSLAEFNQISAGMSYAQVLGIVGGPGTVQAQSNVAGYNTIIYGWTGEGDTGANASVTFQNDREVSKAQAGLQ